MKDKKYTHYVSVPLTARLCFSFESENERPSFDEVSDAFYGLPVSLVVQTRDGKRSRNAWLDEYEVHERLNRGNVCHAVCLEWEIDETEHHDD